MIFVDLVSPAKLTIFISTLWLAYLLHVKHATLKVWVKSNCPIINHSKNNALKNKMGKIIAVEDNRVHRHQTDRPSGKHDVCMHWTKNPLKIQLNINYMLTFLSQFCSMWNKCVVWCQKPSFSEFCETKTEKIFFKSIHVRGSNFSFSYES